MAAFCIMAKKAAGSGGAHAAVVSQSQFERRLCDVEGAFTLWIWGLVSVLAVGMVVNI